ncbi:hypothetical protein KJJ36_01180 [Staphylococcus pseudoxylosus]|uniref:hypothetical protein n=1 Tax=Staphylococcus pseudoxylosus TaxID=2282419 RepID=UPI001F2A5A1B|nr:hypothetical protein [Staphylococcus pseudoxylosus]MCE5001002.1 hypothetical protein [Staphylococcus pseudoxylosus]
MKFFIGFISATVIIALTLTGIYAYKELKPNENDSAQTNEQNNKSNETPAQQVDNEQTAPAQQEGNENAGQTAPATIPSHENGNTEKQGKSDMQNIQGQYNGLTQHLKERAGQGADADELHEIQTQIDDYATQHASDLNFD